jgi:hypothetical protein
MPITPTEEESTGAFGHWRLPDPEAVKSQNNRGATRFGFQWFKRPLFLVSIGFVIALATWVYLS